MSDIVERLRTDQAWNDAGNDPGGLQGDIWGEAADEIDRLRADNARLRTALKPFAIASDSYDDDPPARVIASKSGAILSVYDLRAAKASLE